MNLSDKDLAAAINQAAGFEVITREQARTIRDDSPWKLGNGGKTNPVVLAAYLKKKLDQIESWENAAEKQYFDMLQDDGRLKCCCGNIFDADKEGGMVSANPYSMPVCGKCFDEYIEEMEGKNMNTRTKEQAKADGYAGFNNNPHICMDIDKQTTITVNTPSGQITFAFMPYQKDGPPNCVDICVWKDGSGDDADAMGIQKVIVFGHKDGRTRWHYSSAEEPAGLTTVILAELELCEKTGKARDPEKCKTCDHICAEDMIKK